MSRIKEIGFYEMVSKSKQYKNNDLEKIVKFCLIHASKFGLHSLVTEICTYLKDQGQEMISNVLHHKDENGKTALFYANKQYQLKSGFDLISLEREAHINNRDKALKCIRKEAGYEKLDLWFLETYKTLHPPSKKARQGEAILALLVTVMPSIFFFYMDFASDITLGIQYYNMAYSEQVQTKCSPYASYETCFKDATNSSSYVKVDQVVPILKNILLNETCLGFDEISPCEETDHESNVMKYKVAFWVMILSILVSVMVYIWNISKTKIEFPGIKKQYARKIVESFMRIIWPIYYIYEEYSDRVTVVEEQERNTADRVTFRQEKKTEVTSEDSWKLLRAVENGIENYVQMMLQMFLILPHISFIISLPVGQILSLSLQNIFNMFSMPDSYCDKSDGYAALGKLTLTMLSLSYGMSSRQATKKGQTLAQTMKNLVLWVSYGFFSMARMIAIFSLLSLEKPMIAVLTFLMVHMLSVLLIQAISYEKMKDHIQYSLMQEIGNNGNHMCPIMTLTVKFMPNLISAAGSHTFLMNLYMADRGTPSFFAQTLFQMFILMENLIMLLFPVVAPEYYPSDECFLIHPRLIVSSCAFWLVGALLQVQINL